MIRKNLDRNTIVYELWKDGRTIERIASETGIPRSTVGYYVRKFNKHARSGEPIILQKREQRDEKKMAIMAALKIFIYNGLLGMIKNGKLDEVHKSLSTLKLLKELKNDILPTKEENDALHKDTFFVTKLLGLVMRAQELTPEKSSKKPLKKDKETGRLHFHL